MWDEYAVKLELDFIHRDVLNVRLKSHEDGVEVDVFKVFEFQMGSHCSYSFVF
jgi:hypothetical protein